MTENFDRSHNQSKPPAVETLDGDIKNSTHSTVKNFLEEETNNNKNKNINYGKYESFNVLSENGDSSSTPTIIATSEQKGQFYIINVVDILKQLGDQIKSLQKGQALLRKDLVKAGVL